MKRFFDLELLDNRYPTLHGLRVLAIVSVIQVHVTWVFAGEQGIRIDGDMARFSLAIFFGMDLFFILSGFLIGSILLHSLDQSGSQNLRRFYLRRVARTFPSYYVVLTTLALTTSLTATQKARLPLEYVYGTNFGSLLRDDIVMFWGWSLALEEQFYLTVPLFFFVLYRLRGDGQRLRLLVGVWAAALVIRLFIYFNYGPWTDFTLYDTLYFRPHTRFDTLVCGVLLAFVHRRFGAQVESWLKVPRHRALVALVSLACLWLLVQPQMFGAGNVQLVHVFAWGSLTSVMYFGWLLLLLHSDGPIHAFLRKPLFRRIATLGYGVYLVHIPLLDRVAVPMAKALQERRVSMLLIWPLSLFIVSVLSLAIAYLLHVFVEKPSLKLRDRFAA